MNRPILHRGGVRPMTGDEIVALNRDTKAAYLKDEGDRVYRELEEWCREHPFRIRAMPTARAAAASRWSLFHVSSAASIAIAVFCVVYFGGQLLRAVLS